MDQNKLQQRFFLSFFIGISVFIFFIFLPFVKLIAIAAIFSTLLYPYYIRILQSIGPKRRSIGALLLLLIVALIIIVPASLVGSKIFFESRDLYYQLRDSNIYHLQEIKTLVENPVRTYFPDFTFDVQKYLGVAIGWVAGNFNGFISNTIHLAVSLVLCVVSIFFFLKDGPEFRKALIKLSPLSNRFDEQIFNKIERTINSVIKSMLLIALIQGLLAGIGLAVFGVPNSTLWGALAAVCALIPGLGTALVIVPAIIYLFFTASIFKALGLLIWGILIVGAVDNFLAPYLYARGIKIHQLLILFSVLGGLVFFGPTGIILGPIVLTLFLSLVDIYREYILHETVVDDVVGGGITK